MNRIYIWREISYEELTHVIRDAKKSHDLPSASQRPSTGSGMAQPTSEAQYVPVPVLGQEKTETPANSQARSVDSPFRGLLVPLRSSADWTRPSYTAQDNPLHRIYLLNTTLILRHPHGHTQKNVRPLLWAPRGPVTWAQKTILEAR